MFTQKAIFVKCDLILCVHKPHFLMLYIYENLRLQQIFDSFGYSNNKIDIRYSFTYVCVMYGWK